MDRYLRRNWAVWTCQLIDSLQICDILRKSGALIKSNIWKAVVEMESGSKKIKKEEKKSTLKTLLFIHIWAAIVVIGNHMTVEYLQWILFLYSLQYDTDIWLLIHGIWLRTFEMERHEGQHQISGTCLIRSNGFAYALNLKHAIFNPSINTNIRSTNDSSQSTGRWYGNGSVHTAHTHENRFEEFWLWWSWFYCFYTGALDLLR